MKYSHLLHLNEVNRRLQRESFDNYRKVILSLCKDYQHFPFVCELGRLVHSNSWTQALFLADSLSKQQYVDATQHFVANQFAALLRKYPYSKGSVDTDPEKKAIESFLDGEHNCKRINQRFRARRLRTKSLLPYEPEIVRMRNFISYCIGYEPNIRSIIDQCNFGPGASIGVHGNATNFARKLLASTWSVSSFAFDYAFGAVMSHAQFREVLFPEHGGFDPGVSTSKAKAMMLSKCAIVQHNKIVFVLKTAFTHRSIAVEPLLNGFLQKGADLEMRYFLKRIGIDLSRQEPNQIMARLGSLDDTEEGFVTLDLRNASNSNATEVSREVLPEAWFDFLNRIRSKSYSLGGSIKEYQMFCSMGNGFCFPLETLIFTAACVGVGAGDPGRDFRVYGDDIIVRKRFAKPLIALLSYLGYAVNGDKTFLEGPFRESCGADWFKGKDVRPFTLDFALDSVQNVFKFLNLSRRNSLTSEFFSGCRPLILRLIPNRLQFWRPFTGNSDTAIDTTGDEHLLSRNCVFSKQTRSWHWKEFAAKPIPDKFWMEFGGRGGEPALVFGALGGSASSCPFSLRRNTRTKVRTCSHPGATSTWIPAIPTYSYRYHYLQPSLKP